MGAHSPEVPEDPEVTEEIEKKLRQEPKDQSKTRKRDRCEREKKYLDDYEEDIEHDGDEVREFDRAFFHA